MLVHTIDPVADPRWREFVEWHPKASVFHHPSWLDALRQTYKFRPIVFTTAHPGKPLLDGLVFCPVQSWLTGKRLVSLPFSDHCDLLADADESRRSLAAHFAKAIGHDSRYAEIRSTDPLEIPPPDNWRTCTRFLRHSISLRSSSNQIFSGFHRNCIQRKIHRAQRERLRYVSGRSENLLDSFYDLMLRTRLRHRVPPQSFRWFQNLVSCMNDQVTIHIAFKEGRAAAAMLTLTHQKTLTYKYGCSDERLNNLGGMPFLFWQVIQEAKSDGLEMLDLGRSEIDNEGLITFKERLGATPAPLSYWTYSHDLEQTSRRDGIVRLAQRFFPRLPTSVLHLPRPILALSGSILYRHLD